jgi:ketosteroid isomerase-like protein
VSDEQAQVLAALDRLGAALGARDPGFADLFAPVADVRLIGSEKGEVAEGRAAIAALADALFRLPVRLGWQWRRRDVSVAGDIAWLFAEGDVVIAGADGERRRPYRLTGVLQRFGDDWRWRQFHGAEPA